MSLQDEIDDLLAMLNAEVDDLLSGAVRSPAAPSEACNAAARILPLRIGEDTNQDR